MGPFQCQLLAALVLFAGVGIAQEPPAADPPEPQFEKPAEGEPVPKAPVPAGEAQPTPTAAGQNLLGQADTSRGEGRRNENVQITLVDNNGARDNSQRVGMTATIIEEFRVERNYFSGEYGNPARGPIHAQAQRGAGLHGTVFWGHNNSIFSARAFFQVGSVQPARQNQFGAAANLALWKGAFFSFNASEDKNRGVVNGNALILTPEEHTPLATDPAVRAIVQRWLDAFPRVAPNRPDIAIHALNTNSPQSTDTNIGAGQLTQRVGAKDIVVGRYSLTGQRVNAFQFVTGQNPNTTNKSHGARVTWNRVLSARTTSDFSAGFDRQGTLIEPTADSVGPIYVNGLTALGPQNNMPIDRAINQWRYSGSVESRRGRHVLAGGLGVTRVQYNGEETDGQRPVWTLRDDFGNSAITNFRLGKPYQLSQSFGENYAGFRNWELSGFAGDRWSVNNRLTLMYGMRWEPFTKPFDVTNRAHVAFDSDWNNIGGNFGFAYRLGGDRGVLRAAYGVMSGQLFPATYGQVRLNPPSNAKINLSAPDLLNPYAALTPRDLDPAHARAMLFEASPDLATPYSHLYNFSWETEIQKGWRLQLGYVGSRSHKLFQTYTFNRAHAVPGIAFTTATINQRRADQSIFDRFHTGNFSRAYYDAGRVSLTVPRWRGATISTSYWFSKSIDLGSDFVSTGAGNEKFQSGGQTELGMHEDMKGLSGFDQPHAFLLQVAYDTGRKRSGWIGSLLRNWNLSSVYLLKSGTPFEIASGSDSPGFGNVDGETGDRVVILDPSILGRTIGNPATSQQLLPRSAFRFMNAPLEMRGNIGRNTFRKGKIGNLNASVSRSWTLPRDFQMSLRAESINLTNTPQFAAPGNQLAAQNFAQITNTLNDGRTFRFTLRFTF